MGHPTNCGLIGASSDDLLLVQDLIAMGPKGRDGIVALLDRNRRHKRKPQWLALAVDPQRETPREHLHCHVIGGASGERPALLPQMCISACILGPLVRDRNLRQQNMSTVDLSVSRLSHHTSLVILGDR